MREQPTGEHLLETARNLLRDELLPALPEQRRHAALMIANAMAIAMRQLKNGEAPEREEAARLERILSALRGNDSESDHAVPRDGLLDLNRQLCLAIREGRADSGALRNSVREHLLRVARLGVMESNPKYLGVAG